ncbi:MAG: tRNA (guanosine(46)-N7)-methyltransferase TrmB [Thermoanaerobaculia bacterium]|nr:tRNA (guanosine(46)-N7)-methyltransferase TrmB [Thermoanaerobaculia bacterium]
MSSEVTAATASRELDLTSTGAPLDLASLVPGRRDWEVVVGFGKGRYLLGRAAEEPESGFLGIERAAKYHGIARERARKRGLSNVIAVKGEALRLFAVVLPRRFARAVHVYFPDPWPKDRHHRRRLFARGSVDLLAGLLRPGGRLFFATDHGDYGKLVTRILDSYPPFWVRRQAGPWPEGPRTNYERKYVREGRPILRLIAELEEEEAPFHPEARSRVLVGYRTAGEE